MLYDLGEEQYDSRHQMSQDVLVLCSSNSVIYFKEAIKPLCKDLTKKNIYIGEKLKTKC